MRLQGKQKNLGSIPTCGENACKFPVHQNQNLQFDTADPITTHFISIFLLNPKIYLGSFPTRGENECIFPRGSNQYLQFFHTGRNTTRLFHSHFSIQPTDIEASRTVGWNTSPGTSVEFGINPHPW